HAYERARFNMETDNLTPFPEFSFQSIDNSGQVIDTFVVRAIFEISERGELRIAENQLGPQLTDSYYGDPKLSSLRFEHGRTPVKPRGELYFVDPVARSPKGNPSTGWPISIRVGPIKYDFYVTGPRYFRRTRFSSWRLSEPELCTEVEVR